MQAGELIEGMIISELRGLCTSCAHSPTCMYYQASEKIIIQCEIFRVTEDVSHEPNVLYGLCTTCDQSPHCKLPGRKEGVWHCNEFA
jgi:hypothetical protein